MASTLPVFVKMYDAIVTHKVTPPSGFQQTTYKYLLGCKTVTDGEHVVALSTIGADYDISDCFNGRNYFVFDRDLLEKLDCAYPHIEQFLNGQGADGVVQLGDMHRIVLSNRAGPSGNDYKNCDFEKNTMQPAKKLISPVSGTTTDAGDEEDLALAEEYQEEEAQVVVDDEELDAHSSKKTKPRRKIVRKRKATPSPPEPEYKYTTINAITSRLFENFTLGIVFCTDRLPKFDPKINNIRAMAKLFGKNKMNKQKVGGSGNTGVYFTPNA